MPKQISRAPEITHPKHIKRTTFSHSIYNVDTFFKDFIFLYAYRQFCCFVCCYNGTVKALALIDSLSGKLNLCSTGITAVIEEETFFWL